MPSTARDLSGLTVLALKAVRGSFRTIQAQHSFKAFADGAIPVAQADEVWFQLHRELASLSTNSAHLISETASRNSNFEAPALIVDAIRHVIAATRIP